MPPASLPLPKYVEDRIKLWDDLKSSTSVEEKSKSSIKIHVSIRNDSDPDDVKVIDLDAIAGETSPSDIADKIGFKNAIISKANGKMHDIWRPLEGQCDLELFTFESPEGKKVFWHSSAHVLGQAIELECKGAQLTVGPPLETGGFYYDVFLPQNATVDNAALVRIRARVAKITQEDQAFSRIVLTKKNALEMFGDNKFKQEIIGAIPEGELTTAYRCGPLIDLCRGPHLRNVKMIAAMEITQNASAYWKGDSKNPPLQRIYGISFPSQAELDEYKRIVAEAAKRDHRTIGLTQELYFFHQLSPGSCFFLPHGARIYNKLMSYIREHYRRRGYTEVVSPNVYNVDLWKQSGHYQNYRENMFSFECEGQTFAMKPMNCPGHCLMFDHRIRSYRDLPIRMADFGVLHRNEVSGALTGLTRVRRFQQDDAHIFARKDQIGQEVAGVLDFLQEAYGHFGFKFSLCLSTRPEKHIGDKALWDEAESQLAICLKEFCTKHGHKWALNPGDGAFYGPKIDIQLTDALKRKIQCGTCQLDFNLPIRFNLQYRTSDAIETDAEAAKEAAGPVLKIRDDMTDEEKEKVKAAMKAEKAARTAANRQAGLAKQQQQQQQQEQQQAASAPESSASAVAAAAAPGSAATKEYEWKEQPVMPGFERPVMIHRAILGSIERMIAVLVEHTGGRWPFWLSPRQVCVVPTKGVVKNESDQKLHDYANSIVKRLHDLGYYVDLLANNKQFPKRMQEALKDGYNFVLVVGPKEVADGNVVNVRFRDNDDIDVSSPIHDEPEEDSKKAKQIEFKLNDLVVFFEGLIAKYK